MKRVERLIREPETAWSNPSSVLTKETLGQLISGEIPTIHLEGFCSEEECKKLTDSANANGFDLYRNTFPPIGRIGLARYDYTAFERANYFEKYNETTEMLRQIYARAFDPVTRFMRLLADRCEVEVAPASERGFGEHSIGVFRNFGKGSPVHMDFVPFEAKGWDVSQVKAHLSWNVYLSLSGLGGRTSIYKKMWQIEDEIFRLQESYGYEDALVRDIPRYTFSPRLGEVVFFNSRNYHRVESTTGNRLTCGSFFGPSQGGNKFLFWG
jgi:hypothetical protein